MEYIRNGINSYDMSDNLDFRKENFKRALNLIEKFISDEKKHETFYDCMINLANTKEEKEIIKSIRDDKIKHNKMFKKIYIEITGKTVYCKDIAEISKPKDLIEGINQALFLELRLMEKSRQIMFALPYQVYRDMLLEIVMDGMKHAIKYNYLLCLNNCSQKKKKHKKEKVAQKINRMSDSLAEAGNIVWNRTKEKIKEENLIEEVIVPGLILGLKRSYMNDDEKSKLKIDIKQDVLVSYISQIFESILGKIKQKVDLDDIIEKCVIPQMLENQ